MRDDSCKIYGQLRKQSHPLVAPSPNPPISKGDPMSLTALWTLAIGAVIWAIIETVKDKRRREQLAEEADEDQLGI